MSGPPFGVFRFRPDGRYAWADAARVYWREDAAVRSAARLTSQEPGDDDPRHGFVVRSGLMVRGVPPIREEVSR